VAYVGWRQTTAFRSEDGKVVGNQSICVGRGEKDLVFGLNFEIFRSLFLKLSYNDISVSLEELHLDAEF
jgi:hypothetical protein